MKIQVLSDIHNEFSVLTPKQTEAEVVVLAGNIGVGMEGMKWAIEHFDKPVIYVAGNHEFYHQEFFETKSGLLKLSKDTNIIFMDNTEHIIGDVRFLGGTLWTDFRVYEDNNLPISFSKQDCMTFSASFLNDYRVIRYGNVVEIGNENNFKNLELFKPEDSVDLHEEHLKFLKKKIGSPFKGKTVVVTHHLPTLKSSAKKYQNDKLMASYASNLEYLMGKCVDIWIHGHMHDSYDYLLNGTRIICNPRGYYLSKEFVSPGNEKFKSDFIVEV